VSFGRLETGRPYMPENGAARPLFDLHFWLRAPSPHSGGKSPSTGSAETAEQRISLTIADASDGDGVLEVALEGLTTSIRVGLTRRLALVGWRMTFTARSSRWVLLFITGPRPHHRGGVVNLGAAVRTLVPCRERLMPRLGKASGSDQQDTHWLQQPARQHSLSSWGLKIFTEAESSWKLHCTGSFGVVKKAKKS